MKMFRIILSTLVAATSNVISVPYLEPRKSTVIVNDPVGFNCSSTNASRLEWFFIRNVSLADSKPTSVNLCVAGQTTAACAEISSFGEIKTNFANVYKFLGNPRNGKQESYLSIPISDSQTAGVYVCNAGFGKMSYSYLNVIDPLPRCNQVSYNTTVEIAFACNFDYFGATANLHWRKGVGNIMNNCTGEHNKISCAIPISSIPDDSCDSSQCNNIDTCHEFVGRSMSVKCIWGVSETTENGLSGHVFYLDKRPIAFIQCFKGSCPTASNATAIALAVTCLVVLLVILALVLLLRRGARTKAEPAMAEVDEVGKSVPVCTEVKSKEVRKPAPVYTEVKIKGRKKAKSNGSENDTFNNDNATYADVVPPQHIPKRSNETSKTSAFPSNQDFDGNNVVYAELGRAPPTFRFVEDRSAPASDGQFDRSEYATIDHTFNAPPPQTNHKQPRK